MLVKGSFRIPVALPMQVIQHHMRQGNVHTTVQKVHSILCICICILLFTLASSLLLSSFPVSPHPVPRQIHPERRNAQLSPTGQSLDLDPYANVHGLEVVSS